MTPRHDLPPASGKGARRAVFADRPRHDPVLSEVPRLSGNMRGAIERLFAARRRPKSKPGATGETCPVEPNRPLNLSGGAAAALEFDD